jgi:diacylglycerol O-acyltransferase/trehalose O-mycolyltransferase
VATSRWSARARSGGFAGLLASSLLLAGCGSGVAPSSPAAIAAASASASVAASSAPSPSSPSLSARADDGAYVASVRVVSDRIRDLTISSPAMGGEFGARLVLPSGYDSDPERSWPVLYLLHGAGEPQSYRYWTETLAIDTLPAADGAILVAPEGGDMGYYSDWYNDGRGGPPAWETFHLAEIRQLIVRSWRASDRMAVMGISMGGFGAISYAGRHPGMFAAAVSLSGVLDISAVPNWFSPRLWGDPQAQSDVWAAHNPATLVERLTGTSLFVAYGSGEPGPLDAKGAGRDDLESLVARMNESFVARSREAGVTLTVDGYGPGSHSAPYWKRELDTAVAFAMAALESPA